MDTLTGQNIPHAFRCGATQEIKDSGSTLALIITSDTWTHAGYEAYLDIQADFAINISRFALDALGSGSEDDDPDHPKTRRKWERERRESPSPSLTKGALTNWPYKKLKAKYKMAKNRTDPYRSAVGITCSLGVHGVGTRYGPKYQKILGPGRRYSISATPMPNALGADLWGGRFWDHD